MKKILGLLVITLVLLSSCTQKQQRGIKNIQSNFGGGLNRTVKVYALDGTLLKEYEGKLDIDEDRNGAIKFDLNGDRVMIYNAITIIEEK